MLADIDAKVIDHAARIAEARNQNLNDDERPWTRDEVLFVALHTGLEELEDRTKRRIQRRQEAAHTSQQLSKKSQM